MVSYVILLATCFLACMLGPLCGIGGGVIMKPVIDALQVMSVSAASFLSGVTVMAMSLYTIADRARRHVFAVDLGSMAPIAIGAAAGGAAGKAVFAHVIGTLASPDLVGGAQAAILLALTALSIAYTLNKARLPHPGLSGTAARAALGAVSGAAWSFLGIGGGPFNLVLLVFFLAMPTGAASQASLLIIAFSQAAGLIQMLAAGTVPTFPPMDLVGMIAMAIAGSIAGMRVSAHLDDAGRDRLYLAALALIGVICAYNLVRFLG